MHRSRLPWLPLPAARAPVFFGGRCRRTAPPPRSALSSCGMTVRAERCGGGGGGLGRIGSWPWEPGPSPLRCPPRAVVRHPVLGCLAAFGRFPASGPEYTIDSVQNNVSDVTARVIQGHFMVPWWVQCWTEGGRRFAHARARVQGGGYDGGTLCGGTLCGGTLCGGGGGGGSGRGEGPNHTHSPWVDCLPSPPPRSPTTLLPLVPRSNRYLNAPGVVPSVDSRLVIDNATGLPVFQDFQPVAFTVTIPVSSFTPGAAPARMVQYGHGCVCALVCLGVS